MIAKLPKTLRCTGQDTGIKVSLVVKNAQIRGYGEKKQINNDTLEPDLLTLTKDMQGNVGTKTIRQRGTNALATTKIMAFVMSV